jgi:hypothetical protein
MSGLNFKFSIPAGALVALLTLEPICLLTRAAAPSDFPTFTVPGHAKEMSTLRDLFWLHYPGSGPKATLWDEWLPDASLWPAVSTETYSDKMRQQWKEALNSRIIDSEGYVATHQHGSIAHQLGWPFPFWNQGSHGCGWHFSLQTTAPPGYRPRNLAKTNGWILDGLNDAGITQEGWNLVASAQTTNSHDVSTGGAHQPSTINDQPLLITAAPWKLDTVEAPFLQLRWQVSNAPPFQAFVEWTTPSATNFDVSRRMYFEAPKSNEMTFTMIPTYRHPLWTGEVAQIRLGLEAEHAIRDTHITLQALFSQYDTRHNINAQNFIRGCAKYFWWTHEIDFLRSNINRMRTAMRFTIWEFHTLDRKVIYTTWIGHDGRSGLKRSANGAKQIIAGQGIGNDYWDILPFGGLDTYATIQYYDALLTLAGIERAIRDHPEWNIPTGALGFEARFLEHHASDVKAEGNRLFWNDETGRFAACVDSDNLQHDYGYTFLNCEAIYYNFASDEHAKSILSWLDGVRTVSTDTSTGPDIYHWRFAPRATTRRNLDWYFWAWSNPESIPWGGQVQDGGAVLGFSYHDLMARLKVFGPDNAWKRLQEIIRWFDEVQIAGGYRKYYDGRREGSLQGGGTPGGLGLDAEFFESAMVPQIMLKGFLGFAPKEDGFLIDPHLPKDWPELTINKIRFQNKVLEVRASHKSVDIRQSGRSLGPCFVYCPHPEKEGSWQRRQLPDAAGSLQINLN